jgi:hypothetical protein
MAAVPNQVLCLLLYVLVIFSVKASVVHSQDDGQRMLHSYPQLSTNLSCSNHKPRIFHPFMYEQCLSRERDGEECDVPSNFGMINITCDDILYVHMNETYSSSLLLSAIGNRDDLKEENPPMMIKIMIFGTQAPTFNVTEVEEGIDEFLTPRPWWKLSHDSSGHSIQQGVFVVTLEHYPKEWRKFLELIVNTQYLPTDQCETHPLIAGRMSGSHPGLMPVLSKLPNLR